MLTVATLLWDANTASRDFSRCYDETWVLKLYHGFKRNLTKPFKFVLFTDRKRELPASIHQELLKAEKPNYSTCIEPYKLGIPMILVGLDTVVTGNIDHLAEYCFTGDTIALPRDPYHLSRACNGVALVPAGKQSVYDGHNGENDMEWMRKQPHVFLDDLWPGQVVSFKGTVKRSGLGDARIVYFHGQEKPHQLNLPWIRRHWAMERPKITLILGGAKCVWDDVEAALDIAEFDSVVACNNAGMEWKGRLDAWVSLHTEKLAGWNEVRVKNGYPPAARFATHTAERKIPFTMGVTFENRFTGQKHSGSSGLASVKYAIQHIGFDKGVCCGIPMDRFQAHFDNEKPWEAARHYRSGWEEALPHLKDRVRSMSGWTKDLLGTLTPEWAQS